MKNFYLKRCFLAFVTSILCLSFSLNAQTGATCSSAIPIASTPYTYSGTTCGSTNNYDDLNVNFCIDTQASYTSGEDLIFAFTPQTTGCYNIELSNTDILWAGLHIFDKCPSDSTTQCIGFLSGNGTESVAFATNETIIIMIDSWSSPTCIDFDLNISLGESTLTNDVCTNAIPLQLEGSNYNANCEPDSWAPDYNTAPNTLCASNDPDAFWSSNENGVWYTFSHTGGNFNIAFQNVVCNNTLGGTLQVGI